MARYLVDTNVMLAASAVFELSGLANRAMPREIELRETVYRWLTEFADSEHHVVLDEEGTVRDEYERNMPFNSAMYQQEYGMQVLQNKIDHGRAGFVPIDILEANGERIAVLPKILEAIVHDREDRKWVACSQAAHTLFEEIPPIVYGAETDWYMIEQQLTQRDIALEKLLPEDWYAQRVANDE